VKAILGWLCDPFLHLLVIGAIVLAVGARMSSEPAKADAAAEASCARCHRNHDDLNECPQLAVAGSYAYQNP
jgi:cytochrome c553